MKYSEIRKQLATDVNNVAATSFQSGKEYTEKPLLAKIKKLEIDNERLRNLMLLADKDLHSATFEKMPSLVKRCIMDAKRSLKGAKAQIGE